MFEFYKNEIFSSKYVYLNYKQKKLEYYLICFFLQCLRLSKKKILKAYIQNRSNMKPVVKILNSIIIIKLVKNNSYSQII